MKILAFEKRSGVKAVVNWPPIVTIKTQLKDTHRKKALTNRTQTLTERMTMEIWVTGILNQLFMGDS